MITGSTTTPESPTIWNWRSNCVRAIILDHGQIIADGRTVELLADEQLMLAHRLERPHILLHLHPH